MAQNGSEGAWASRRLALLSRRRRAEPDAGAGSDPVDRRRRIAGERPRSGDVPEAETAEETPGPETTSGAGGSGPGPATQGRRVAALTSAAVGVVVAALLTGLVYAGMEAFQAIYDTPAGDGVGAAVLVGVLLVSLLTGRFLLRWRGLPDPNATSLLAIMLLALVTLGLLMPIVFSPWMLAITPALGGLSYLVAHLVIAHLG